MFSISQGEACTPVSYLAVEVLVASVFILHHVRKKKKQLYFQRRAEKAAFYLKVLQAPLLQHPSGHSQHPPAPPLSVTAFKSPHLYHSSHCHCCELRLASSSKLLLGLDAACTRGGSARGGVWGKDLSITPQLGLHSSKAAANLTAC